MNDAALRQAVTEATAAFDAGNHAWGRFLLYVLRPYRGHPSAPSPARVRAALQDAVLAVPRAPDPDELRAFYDALRAAHRALEAFIPDLPETIRTGDILVAPDAIAEAISYLVPWSGEAREMRTED